MTRTDRSRARRLLRGLTVSFATLCVLGVALELGVRLLVPDATFSKFEPLWRRDPHAGFTMRPGFDGIAYRVPVHANALGFRGPDWSLRKAPGTHRIALLGDSHAFGYGVAWPDTVAPRLQDALAAGRVRAEVLNFALPGYNAWQQHEVLRHYALAYEPDLVIVQLTMNDHEPASWCDDAGWLHSRGDQPSTQALLAAPPPATTSGPGLLARSRFYLWARLQWRRYRIGRDTHPTRWPSGHWLTPPQPGPLPEYMRGAVLEPLLGMARACRERGVPLLLAAMVVGDDYRRTVDAFAAETGVPVLMLFELFPEISNWEQMVREYGLGWDDHLDGRAHERWAQGIAQVIVERQLLRR